MRIVLFGVGFHAVAAVAKGLELFPLAAQRGIVARGSAECLAAAQVEVRRFEADHHAASAACRMPRFAPRCSARAPMLQHALQQLAGRRLGDIVAELKLGRGTALLQHGDARQQALPEFSGFQPAAVAGRLRCMAWRMFGVEVHPQRHGTVANIFRRRLEQAQLGAPAPRPAGDPGQVPRRKLIGAGGTQQLAFRVGRQRAGLRAAVTRRIVHGNFGDTESFRGGKDLVQLAPVGGIRQLLAATHIHLPVGEYRERALGQQC